MIIDHVLWLWRGWACLPCAIYLLSYVICVCWRLSRTVPTHNDNSMHASCSCLFCACSNVAFPILLVDSHTTSQYFMWNVDWLRCTRHPLWMYNCKYDLFELAVRTHACFFSLMNIYEWGYTNKKKNIEKKCPTCLAANDVKHNGDISVIDASTDWLV